MMEISVDYEDVDLNAKVHRFANILSCVEKQDHWEYQIEVDHRYVSLFQ